MTAAEIDAEIAEVVAAILKVAREHDQDLWACGDALVAETDGSRKQLREARAELEAKGHDTEFSTLSRSRVTLTALYRTAKLFPPAKRQPIAWEWHAMAHSERELMFIVACLQDDQQRQDETAMQKLLTIARGRGRLA